MPVTFNDEQNQAAVYIDPAFRYDTSPRLLGREQYHKIVDFSGSRSSHSNGKGSRTSTPTSEYKRAYSRSSSPDNETDNNILPVNVVAIDQACYETKSGLQDDDNITSQTDDLHCFTSQQQQDTDPGFKNDIQLRDYLANRAFYTTSTQKLYQGVDWCNRVRRSPAPPNTSKELNADTVSHRFESKRYEPRKENWQQFGSRPFSWDYVQTRDGHHIKGPIRFCSPHKKITHLPGYMGHVSGGPGEIDNPKSPFNSRNKQKTLQPKYTDTARKGNIPGYTGCVLFYDHRPACIDDPEHLRSTTASTYRPHDEIQCNIRSPYKKASPMSRMVTLTHPFNPFNKVH